MKGTHMSGRDLIYRDLSCWPTPLHYHPGHACGSFYLTLLHPLPLWLPNQPSVCLYVCLSVIFVNHIFAYDLYVRPKQMDLPYIKYLFFPQMQERHAADYKRLILLCK